MFHIRVSRICEAFLRFVLSTLVCYAGFGQQTISDYMYHMRGYKFYISPTAITIYCKRLNVSRRFNSRRALLFLQSCSNPPVARVFMRSCSLLLVASNSWILVRHQEASAVSCLLGPHVHGVSESRCHQK